MLAKQRYSKILELLEKEGIVHTAKLVELMGVSSETVRKDLEYLDSQGKLSRVHGGAVALTPSESNGTFPDYISLQVRSLQNVDQKKAISLKATELIEEGQVVALDYGSTSQIMAEVLRDYFSNLTVITNSIHNALVLSQNPGITVILIGGVLNRDEYTLVDEFSTILDNIHIDVMFMSVTGIDPVIGCTDQRLSELRIQNKFHSLASRTIVLADSSKFGRASLLKICPIDEIDVIVTDAGLSPEMTAQFQDLGPELVVAPY